MWVSRVRTVWWYGTQHYDKRFYKVYLTNYSFNIIIRISKTFPVTSKYRLSGFCDANIILFLLTHFPSAASWCGIWGIGKFRWRPIPGSFACQSRSLEQFHILVKRTKNNYRNLARAGSRLSSLSLQISGNCSGNCFTSLAHARDIVLEFSCKSAGRDTAETY